MMTNTSSTQSKWRSPTSSRRSRREEEPIIQDNINWDQAHQDSADSIQWQGCWCVCCDAATGSSESDNINRVRSFPKKVMNVSDKKVSSEDDYLSPSMTIEANSTIVRENLEQSFRQQDWVSAFPCLQALTRRCMMSVWLQCERNRIGTWSSNSKMSKVECEHPGNFLFMWCQRVSGVDQSCAENCRDSASAKTDAEDADDVKWNSQ